MSATRETLSRERLFQLLLLPLITEKATHISNLHQQIAFKVRTDASKREIKAAVELMFDVKVARVTVLNVAGKKKRSGKVLGCRSNWKKAYVSLMSGQQINFLSLTT